MTDRWENHAACIGKGDLFFGGERETRPVTRARVHAAKAICATCTVRAECLADAAEHGIWGGLTETERDRLDRGHTLDAVAAPAEVRDQLVIDHLRANGPSRTGDIQSVLGLAQASTHYVLAGLREAGIVDMVRAGNHYYYRLTERAAAS